MHVRVCVCVHVSMYVCMYGLGYFKILRENHFLVLDNLHMYSNCLAAIPISVADSVIVQLSAYV